VFLYVFVCVCVCVDLSVSVSDDHSRVHLQRHGIDYINSSLVVAREAERSYILTQVKCMCTSAAGVYCMRVRARVRRASCCSVSPNAAIYRGEKKCTFRHTRSKYILHVRESRVQSPSVFLWYNNSLNSADVPLSSMSWA